MDTMSAAFSAIGLAAGLAAEVIAARTQDCNR